MSAPSISLPRQLGNPARLSRLARVPGDLERFTLENNGRAPCFISVYRFRPEAPDSLQGGPERWAIFDRVFLDFDSPGDMGRALEECRRVALALKARYGLTYRAAFSGAKGFHLYPVWQPYPVKLENFRPLVREIIHRLGNNLRLEGLDPSPKDGAARLCRIMNTINPKSGLYCVPLLPVELEDPASTLEDVLDLARGPRHLKRGEIAVTPTDFNARLAGIERELEAAREAERRRRVALPPPRPRGGRRLAHPRITPLLQHGAPVGHRRAGGCVLAAAAREDGLGEPETRALLETYRSRCPQGETFGEADLRSALDYSRRGLAIPWRWLKELENARSGLKTGPGGG